MRSRRVSLLILAIFCYLHHFGQDTIQSPTISVAFLEKVSKETRRVTCKLAQKTDQILLAFQKQENSLNKKIRNLDEIKYKQIFDDVEPQLKIGIEHELKSEMNGSYNADIDTIYTSLKFLSVNQEYFSKARDVSTKISKALENTRALRYQLEKAEQVKSYLKRRQELLNSRLSSIGVLKELRKLNQNVFYYSQQIKQYTSILKDRKKFGQKTIDLLRKNKKFTDFFRRNSQFASMFGPVCGSENIPNESNIPGLQTRLEVSNSINHHVGSDFRQNNLQLQSNIKDAQSQITALKEKILKTGGTNSEDIYPAGFKPNDQKTKKFFERLEISANIQSQKGGALFPNYSDLGFSTAYKWNNSLQSGLGISYKLGLGRDFRHLKLSHEGIGLRSFVDWKLKGNLWVTGAYEMNFRSAFRSLDELRGSSWQESGLVGMTKIVSVKSRILKQTKVQVLWDFLSYSRRPVSPAILFRIGYSF